MRFVNNVFLAKGGDAGANKAMERNSKWARRGWEVQVQRREWKWISWDEAGEGVHDIIGVVVEVISMLYLVLGVEGSRRKRWAERRWSISRISFHR